MEPLVRVADIPKKNIQEISESESEADETGGTNKMYLVLLDNFKRETE